MPKRWRLKFCSTASTPAARSPASMAWARTRRRTCRRCSAKTTSMRCNASGVPSILPASVIPARSSRPHGCAVKCQAPIGSTRSNGPVSPSASDADTRAGTTRCKRDGIDARRCRPAGPDASSHEDPGQNSGGRATPLRATRTYPRHVSTRPFSTSPATWSQQFLAARRSRAPTRFLRGPVNGCRWTQALPIPPRSAASSPPTTADRGGTSTAPRGI